MKINNPFTKNNLLIFLPVILVMIFDFLFPLIGQPEIYWTVGYAFNNEGSPLGELLLGYHPEIFAVFFAFYLSLVLFLSANLKRPFNIMVAVGFFLGHAWGSASWIPLIVLRFSSYQTYADFNEWYATVAYFIVIAVISGFCISKWLKITYGK